MGLPPREAGGQSNTATVGSISSSIINMGYWVNQPPTSIQDDDHTPDDVWLLSMTDPRKQRQWQRQGTKHVRLGRGRKYRRGRLELRRSARLGKIDIHGEAIG